MRSGTSFSSEVTTPKLYGTLQVVRNTVCANERLPATGS